MDRDPAFRTDLYRGTAPYYDRFRPPYPAALFDDVLARTGRSGRLLDLACGTGQIAVPLAGRFDSVVAVDQEPESVAFGREKCSRLGIRNVDWVVGSAETVGLSGKFDLITVGNAFQRLDRAAAASRMMSWLPPGGAVALVWSGLPWVGELAWQKALFGLFVDWVNRMGVADRVPAGFEERMESDPHEQVLRRAGFDYVGKFQFVVERVWTVEELAGCMYSTSLLNLGVLRDSADEFERDLASRLLGADPGGRFPEPTGFAYELAVAR